MSRGKIAIGAAVALAVAGVAMILSRIPSMERSAGQFREGMTYDEVRALLGKPSEEGTYDGPYASGVRWARWQGSEGEIYASFDEESRIRMCTFTPSTSPGLFQRVLAWFGL